MTRRDLALDIGSTNLRVYRQGDGIVFDEPTVVAVHGRRGEALAVGREALDLLTRDTPGVTLARPVERGVITEFEVASQMIRLVLQRVGVGRWIKPRALVAVPSFLTPVERRAVQDAVEQAGARSVSLVDELLAAAVGAGLPIRGPLGNMVVDVGGGVSSMAMGALGGLLLTKAVRVGGQDMDAAIKHHVRKRYGLVIGEASAERVKKTVGSAYPAADARSMEVTGRELATAMPKSVWVAPDEIREVLSETVRAIADTTRECLSESPPELAHDVLETGVFLTGGGALLRGLDVRLSHECEVPVHLTDDPRSTVAIGVGRLLDVPDGDGAIAVGSGAR